MKNLIYCFLIVSVNKKQTLLRFMFLTVSAFLLYGMFLLFAPLVE